MIPIYHGLFCAFFNSNWNCFCKILSLICVLACSNLSRLLGLLPWPCFTCWIYRSMLSKLCDKLSNCLFHSATEGPLPCAIVLKKVTSFATRLTPVCWQAFDVVKIWVKVNIRSRSTQTQNPLNCLTCLTKFHLLPCLKPGISVYLFNMLSNKHQRILCLIWPGSDVHFDPDMSHIKGSQTDRCHFNYGHRCRSSKIVQQNGENSVTINKQSRLKYNKKGIMGGQGQNLPWAKYWESHLMNRLTGQLIVRKTYSGLAKVRNHWQIRVLQHWTNI